jgi:hypothetical protein
LNGSSATQLSHPPSGEVIAKRQGGSKNLRLGDLNVVLCIPVLVIKNRKEGKVLCYQTKLSVIASSLAYLSALKLALWHGYSETENNRRVFVFETHCLFKRLLFETADPLLIVSFLLKFIPKLYLPSPH